MPLNSDLEPHKEGFIRLALLAPFMTYLKDRGLDPKPALEQVGLSPDQVTDSAVFVHAELIFGLLESFAEIADDRYFGMRVGEAFDLHSWPPFAVALQSASTLFEFLADFVQLVPQESSAVRHGLVIEPQRAIYSVARLQEPTLEPIQTTGFGAAIYVRLLQLVTGDAWDPSVVRWESRYIGCIPPRYAGIETRFSPDPGMRLSFPYEWLFGDVSDVAKQSLPPSEIPSAEITLVAAMRSVLRDRLDDPDLNPETVAGILGIQADRLVRALKHHDTTLPREIKRLKVDVAKDLLRNSSGTAAEIGAKLGYTDKAHFTRFFKSQTGMTPMQFRGQPFKLQP